MNTSIKHIKKNLILIASSRRYRFLFSFFIIFIASYFQSDSVFAQKEGPEKAQEAAGLSWFDPRKYVYFIIGYIFLIIINLVGHLLTLAIYLLHIVVGYNDFINTTVVTVGWETVRDIANIFFVFILLVIAIGTILNQENYHYKRALPRMVIMAIVINFSKVICGLIIDVAQLFAFQFVHIIKTIGPQQLFVSLGITRMLTVIQTGFSVERLELTDFILGLGVGLIFLIIAFIVIAVYLLIFIFRIVALWILIVLSPLAFFLAAWPSPQAQGYAKEWWDNFLKYVFIGPILAFFLWLAFTATARDGILNLQSTQGQVFKGGFISEITSPENLARFIVTIGLLIVGLAAASRAGVAGSELARSAINKISRSPAHVWGGTKRTSAWLARKIYAGRAFGRWTTGLQLNPFEVIRGMREAFELKKKIEEMEGAAGSAEAMKKGGAAMFFKGFGAPRDLADAYLKGFLFLPGMLRYRRALFGGPEAAKNAMKEADDRREEAIRKHEISRIYTDALNRTDFVQEGKERWIERQLEAEKNVLIQGHSDVNKDENYEMEEDKEGEMKKGKHISEVMEEQKILTKSIDELRQEGNEHEAMIKEKFLNDWFLKRARERLGKDAQEKIDSRDIDFLQELHVLGKEELEERAEKGEEEAARVRGGGLTDSELKEGDDRLYMILLKIAQLNREIRDKAKAGIETRPADLQLDQLLKERNSIALFDNKTKKWEIDKTEKWEMPKGMDAKEEEVKKKERKAKLRDIELEAQKNKIFAQSLDWNQKERIQKQEDAETLEKESAMAMTESRKKMWDAVKYIPARAFYAERERASLENEEARKISTHLDEELMAAFNDAVSEGNSVKASAIMKKIAEDANDNELWNKFGFESNSTGMKNFFEAAMMGKKGIKLADGTEYTGPKLKIGEQTALSIANAIAEINEEKRHWETSRMVTVENGLYRWNTQEEHTKIALGEILKLNPREVARNFNRLAYGGEVPNPKGGRDFKLAPLGIAILKALGPEIASRMERGQSEFNKNAVMNIIGKQFGELEKHGIDPDYRKYGQRKLAELRRTALGTTVDEIVDSFFDRFMREMKKKAKNK